MIWTGTAGEAVELFGEDLIGRIFWHRPSLRFKIISLKSQHGNGWACIDTKNWCEAWTSYDPTFAPVIIDLPKCVIWRANETT